MASLEFTIPLFREDLLRQGDRTHYFVAECSSSAEVTARMDECKDLLSTDSGPGGIRDCFDTFYSLLREFNNVSPYIREEYWNTVLQALEAYCKAVGEMELSELDFTVKRETRNTLKMLVYVVVQLVEDFESEATKPDAQNMAAPKGRRGGKKKSSVSASSSLTRLGWGGQRERVVELLSQLAELELQQLWEPPTVQMMEDLSGLMAGCCYKLLENPAFAREKTLKEKVFHLLGMLVKKYSMTLGVSLKLIQLLQHFEHLVSPLAEAVGHIATKFEARGVVAEVIRELGSKDPRDLALDTSGTRCFAAFLVEVAQSVPEAVLPTVSVLLPHLGGESYTMRNGVLGVLGEIVGQVLSSVEVDEQSKATRDQLLDKLEEHLHDVNAFVRSKALQIWLHLCNAKAIPLPRQKALLELVAGRLRDKSSNVRKNAVQLLATFLTNNPFAGKLDEGEFQTKLVEEEARLKSLLPPEPEATPTSQENTFTEMETVAGADEKAVEVAKQMAVVQYLRDGLAFIHKMAECIPIAMQLLGSKVVSDVLESLEFLATAFEFQVGGSREGVRKALLLVWSREQQVREAVVNAYVRLYLNPSVQNPRMKTAAIVRNLLLLADGASYGDLTSLEEMISLLMKADHIPSAVIRMLWDTFTLRVPNTTRQQSRMALLMLSMMGSADRDIVKSNLDILVSCGLKMESNDDSPTPDLILAKYACVALQKLANPKGKKGAIAEKPNRFPSAHPMFQQITSILELELTNVKTSQWTPLAEQAIAAIYKLSEQPDEVCGSLLKALAGKVFRADGVPPTADTEDSAPVPSRADGVPPTADTEDSAPVPSHADGVPPTADTEDSVPVSGSVGSLPENFDPVSCSSQDPTLQGDPPSSSLPSSPFNPLHLSRLLFSVGHVAQWQLVHLEVAITRELKRRRAQERETPVGNEGHATSTSKKKTPGKGTTDTPNIEEEMGLAGAAADDAEAELMRRVCEIEVGEGGLLGWFEPLIVAVVTNPSRYPFPALQASAALSLAKFMLISPSMCDKYLQLLFTLLEKSPEPTIRANTIIAAGDLTFRFPNLVEPWTPYLYARLRDDSPLVRKNTMVVLTHLILNDMVKVKGQISAMALCLEDPVQQIADLAKLFFHELSKKGNALYNVLPDIISHLSDPQKPVSQETFRSIMKYVLSFIQKDRQCESLVEKLCHRFRATRTERQWRDIAHCLSQLNFTERCVRKLQENFACFQDKLVDGEVYAAFTAIATKAKKFAKPEAKALVEELEKRLHEAHTKGLEEAEAVGTQEAISDPQEGSGAEPGSEGSPERPNVVTGEGEGGEEAGTAGEKVTDQSGGGEGNHDSGARDDTVADDKENHSPPKPPAVTPANKSRKKPKSTAKKRQKPLAGGPGRNRNVIVDNPFSDDDFETDVLSSARKALIHSARKSKSSRKPPSRSAKKVVFSSSEEEDGWVPNSVAKKGQRLLLSDDDD